MLRYTLRLAVLVLAPCGAAVAQDSAPDPKSAPPTPSAIEAKSTPRPDRLPTATIQVLLAISRFKGETKLASLPYTFLVPSFSVAAGPRERVRMRMGIDTPVPKTAVVGDARNATGTTEVQYRTVGTNVDCWVADLGDGRFQVNANVENSSALAGPDASSSAAPGVPLFRRFETSISPILKPGQSVQAIASTDPVTGEVVKIDVTLNVVK